MIALPEWIPIEAWAGYVEMRKKIKKVMTPRAEAMQIKTLEEFRDAGYDVAEILDNSTMNNWTSLYQPKEKAGAAKGKLPQLGKQGQRPPDQGSCIGYQRVPDDPQGAELVSPSATPGRDRRHE